MSSSPEFSSRTAKSAEKPGNFSRTCTLLSQYLKENGNFGDLNLGMTCNSDTKGSSEMFRQRSTTTMELFPLGDKSRNMSTENTITNNTESWNMASMNLLPPKTAPNPFLSEEKSKKPQMTIFYAGQVYVFDDFPADKVKDVMSLATKSSCQSNQDLSVVRKMVPSPVNPSSSPVSTNSNSIPSATTNLIPELSQPQPTIPVIRDLPIARKASLHRFLEKRKDRIASKAPYQTSSPVSVSCHSKTTAETKPWLGLAAQAPQ